MDCTSCKVSCLHAAKGTLLTYQCLQVPSDRLGPAQHQDLPFAAADINKESVGLACLRHSSPGSFKGSPMLQPSPAAHQGSHRPQGYGQACPLSVAHFTSWVLYVFCCAAAASCAFLMLFSYCMETSSVGQVSAYAAGSACAAILLTGSV